jgi:hypothetical protein
LDHGLEVVPKTLADGRLLGLASHVIARPAVLQPKAQG